MFLLTLNKFTNFFQCYFFIVDFEHVKEAGWLHHLSRRNRAFSKKADMFLQLSSMKFYINLQLEIQKAS